MKRLGLDIELTNICNATCAICDRKSMELQGLWTMTDEVYDAILKKWVPYLKIMSFWWIWDPFLDKNFWSRISLLLQEVEKQWRKYDLHIFVYSKMQNMSETDFLQIKEIQDLGYNFTFYLSIFTFRRKYYSMLTGLSYDQFQKNFDLLRKSWVNYKINFTLTKYGVDELPYLIKNFSNYQIETIHDFRWEIDTDAYLFENMKDIDFSARQSNVPNDLLVSSFSITHTGEFRYTDEDSRRDVKIWNITEIDFKQAADIYANLASKWAA